MVLRIESALLKRLLFLSQVDKNENISQIMWPSLFVNNLDQGALHARAHHVAKLILGEDMAFDFDMLIAKVFCERDCFFTFQNNELLVDINNT